MRLFSVLALVALTGCTSGNVSPSNVVAKGARVLGMDPAPSTFKSAWTELQTQTQLRGW